MIPNCPSNSLIRLEKISDQLKPKQCVKSCFEWIQKVITVRTENQIWGDSGGKILYFHEVEVEAYSTISVYLCIIFIEPFNFNDSAVVCFGIDVVLDVLLI